MRIEVIGVDVENKGKWTMAKVAYKGPDGKIEGKNLVSFDNKEVYKLLCDAKQGDLFDVKSEKNDKGHWNWVEASPAGKNTGAAGTAGAAKQASQTARSTYETPEERAKRQVYIVRQSSVSAAIALAEANGGEAPITEEDIINSARKFEAYVFGLEPVVEAAEVE